MSNVIVDRWPPAPRIRVRWLATASAWAKREASSSLNSATWSADSAVIRTSFVTGAKAENSARTT